MSRYHLSKNYVPGTVCRDGKLLSIHEVVDELNRLAEQLADARRDVAEANDARQVAVDARLAAEERELALAAQCQRYREAVFHFNRSRGDINPLLCLLSEEPTTSLMRQKDQWQAETADMIVAALRVHGMTEAEGLVADLAAGIRRQAEESANADH